MYLPGSDDLWDVWVSLKFEGGAFGPAGVSGGPDVYFDRAVFVGPFAGDERGGAGYAR